MFRTFQRVRHIKRYREIVQVLVKYGFGEVLDRLGLPDRVYIPFVSKRRTDADDTTHLGAPQRLRLALEELGPTFIKFGQSLSTRPDVVPPDFLPELEKLQDRVPPNPWEDIRYVIEQELGGPVHQFFDEVDPQPIAAASLAQVHTARLKDGTLVVLKVQRPNIEHQIQIDLEILEDVANLIQAVTPLGKIYDLPDIVEDFAYTIDLELNYRYEAQHAETFRRNFTGNKDVYIPAIYWDYVTENLLVMERLHGIKIDNLQALDEASLNRKWLARRATRLIIKEVLEDGFFHADPHPGNLLVMEGGVIGVMDFGIVGWLDTHLRLTLSQLYIVIVKRDVDAIVERLIQLGVAAPDVEKDDLRHDISRLLRKYHGRHLQDLSANEFTADLTPIVFRNKLRFPTDLWLLLKTLAMMEGIGKRLDPEFDVFSVSQPYVRRLGRQMRSPAMLWDRFMDTGASLTTLLMTAPDMTIDLMRRLEAGKLKLLIEPTEYDRLLGEIDLAVSRLSVSLLIAAMILGLALLIPRIDEANTWFYIFLVGMFVTSSIMGLWMAYSILRGSK